MKQFDSVSFPALERLHNGVWDPIDKAAICSACGLVLAAHWRDRYPAAVKCICEEKDKNETERRFQLSNLPNRESRTFNNFKMPPGSAEAFNAVRAFADGYPPHILLLWGEPGSGKTHLLEAAARQLLGSEFNIRYEYTPDFLNRIRATFSNKENTEDVLNYYRNVPVLFLDDIGTEKASDWTSEALTTLVDERYRNERRLLITTNCNYQELSDRGYKRLASRIFDTETGAAWNVQVNGDYRLRR